MDQNNHHHHHHHPTHCDTGSFSAFEPWTTRGIDVKKKRKLLIEQLSLPTPKLPCLGPRSTSFPYGHNFKFNKNHPHQEEEEEESNLAKMAIEVEMSKLEEVEVQGNKRDGIKDEMQRSYGHEEDLLEFGSHENSSIIIDEQFCSASDCATQSSLLPQDSNHELVLSSGRWSIDPEAKESGTIKPTIDQEFEQYFSVLLPSLDP